MIRAIFVLLLFIGTSRTFSQPIRYSQSFECKKKNVPIAILNKHPDFFYLLRYNKSFHDFVVERRQKESGELVKATALGLDVINANWFNYEYLDYIFHELNGKLYLIFEKVLIDKREIYFRSIDSLGRPGEFTLLAALDKGPGVEDINFEFKLCGNDKVLIVGTEMLNGGRSKKLAIWYDLIAEEVIWAKKLPLEWAAAGYSGFHETNSKGDLYYLYYRSRVLDYARKYMEHTQALVPILEYDIVAMACMPAGSKTVITEPLSFTVGNLNYASITVDTSHVLLSMNYSAPDTIKESTEHLYFYNQRWTAGFKDSLYAVETPMNTPLEQQLNFYDGMDFSSAAYKEYPLLERRLSGSKAYFLSGRNDGDYFKEMFLAQLDVLSGKIVAQNLIPRKIFFFGERTRYKNLGICNTADLREGFCCFVLENPANLTIGAKDFKYHKFVKQGTFNAGNLIAYVLRQDGSMEKKLIHGAENFEYIPVPTENAHKELLFYLSSGKWERFAFLSVD